MLMTGSKLKIYILFSGYFELSYTVDSQQLIIIL